MSRRDKLARKAALEQYAKAHDHFSEKEQLAAPGSEERDLYHQWALWALRAYRAELDDPTPKERVKA